MREYELIFGSFIVVVFMYFLLLMCDSSALRKEICTFEYTMPVGFVYEVVSFIPSRLACVITYKFEENM